MTEGSVTPTEPLTFMGSPGSPYTRKMLALLRYRRLPYRLLPSRGALPDGLPAPKVALMPTFFLPNSAGEIEAIVDSTPLIRRLELDYAGRSVIPADPALRFLDFLLEDYADEWLTKAMFHYRWTYQADIDKSTSILPRWTVRPQAEEEALARGEKFSERQISRLYVVGSNDETAPVIETSYQRYLAAMKAHLECSSFAFGARPASSDFGMYGQLTQLATFDPTPMKLTLEDAPVVYAWVGLVDDLSGLEAGESDWTTRDAVPDSLAGLFKEVGTYYVPALLANANALMNGETQVVASIAGARWTQKPFAYQGKCLQWLRDGYKALASQDQAFVDEVLAGTGCERLFA